MRCVKASIQRLEQTSVRSTTKHTFLQCQASPRHEDDGNTWLPVRQCLGDRPAGPIGQVKIKQQHTGRTLGEARKCFRSSAGKHDDVPIAFKRLGQYPADVRVVAENKYRLRYRLRSLRGPA